MKLFLLFLVFSFSTSLAKDLGELYKEDVPLKVRTNPAYSKLVSEPLEVYAEFDPELIYFFIKYVNAKFDSTSNDKFFIDNLSKFLNYYKNLHDDWIRSLEKEIQNGNFDNRLKQYCLSYLDDNLYDVIRISIPGILEKIEINHMDYFIVKYYLKDKKMKYNPEENYHEKRIMLDKEQLELFNEMSSSPKDFSKSDLDKMLSYRYVFNNPEIEDKNLPVIAIASVLKEHYKAENSYSKYMVSFGYSYQYGYMHISNITYGSSLFTFEDGTKYEFYTHPISASLNYKLFLSPYTFSFCYIDFQLGAGYSPINQIHELTKIGFWRRRVDGVAKRSEILDFSKNEAKITGSEFMNFNVSTPLFFFGRLLSFDAGFGFMLVNTDYKISYIYSYRKFDTEFLGPNILKSESGSVSDKKLNHINLFVYPVVSLNINLVQPSMLKLGATLNEAFVSVGFNL